MGLNVEKDFAELTARAGLTLSRLAATVEQVRPTDSRSFSIETSQLCSANYLKDFDRLIKGFAMKDIPTLYVFSTLVEDGYEYLAKAFIDRPESRSGSTRTYAYSRLNLPIEPSALYVGSSWHLPSRVSQHLGRTGGDGTYAMRLNLWAASLDCEIGLQVWRFEPEINSIELEAIEQQLWSELKPLLGKKSGR